MLGPDEPRYASIGREMARSGDWVVPRLWGEAWYEKPPLLYWMTALAYRAGLPDDLAPRLPVALLSLGFLLFFWDRLRREFGEAAAWASTLMLATMAGWLAYSQIAVTDLPLSACLGAALLLVLPWLDRGKTKGLPAAGALLGLAMLAKGLLPLVLALPVVWFGRRKWTQLVLPAGIGLAVAAPWFVAATMRDGRAMFDELILKHHFGRFTSDALQHEQPFWFYVPVLLAGALPWTPFVFLWRGVVGGDVRRRFVLAWLAWGFLFFSLSRNKLPGYVLPLLPAVAILCGLAAVERPRARVALWCSAALLGLMPVVTQILPDAIVYGLSKASWEWDNAFRMVESATLILVAAEVLRRRKGMGAALAATAAVAGIWIAVIKKADYPVLDALASARQLYREVKLSGTTPCVASLHRGYRYGLNYYTGTPLADCAENEAGPRIEQAPGERPRVVVP